MFREDVQEVLSNCREGQNPDLTRKLILNLITNKSQDSQDIITILLQELFVLLFHGKDSNITQTVENTPISLLGSVALPRPQIVDDKSSSASDVPSHSSNSSEDGQDNENEETFSEELWKKTINSNDNNPGSINPSTHKDFFDTLIKDIETDGSWTETTIELNPALNEIQSNEVLSPKSQSAKNTDNSVFLKLEEYFQSKKNELITLDVVFNISQVICDELMLEKDQAIYCQEDVEIILDPFVGQIASLENIETIIKSLKNMLENQLQSSDKICELSDSHFEMDQIDKFDETKIELVSSSQKLITPAKSSIENSISSTFTSASKRPRINFHNIDPNLPAWKIPKSPLDKLFRSGYGGFGQPTLDDVIKIVEVEDGKSDDDVSVLDNQSIMIEDLPDDFGKELFEKSFENEEEFIDISKTNDFRDDELMKSDENYTPDDHPSTAVPIDNNGDYNLTSKSSLNNMILESYRNLVKHYSKKDQSAPVTESIVMNSGFHYDYDETTCGTSIDSDGYRKYTDSNRSQLYRIGENSPNISPDKKKIKGKLAKKKILKSQKPETPSASKNMSKSQEFQTHSKISTKSFEKSKKISGDKINKETVLPVKGKTPLKKSLKKNSK